MAKILAKNLANKRAMLTDGSELGIASDVVIDIQSGDLIYLVVKPSPVVDTSKFKTQDDYLLIPFEAVKAAKDYTIIDKKIVTNGKLD